MEEIQHIFVCICMTIFGRCNNFLICFMQYALKVSGLEYFESKKETFPGLLLPIRECHQKPRSYFVVKNYVPVNVNHYLPRRSVKNEGQILEYRLRK